MKISLFFSMMNLYKSVNLVCLLLLYQYSKFRIRFFSPDPDKTFFAEFGSGSAKNLDPIRNSESVKKMPRIRVKVERNVIFHI